MTASHSVEGENRPKPDPAPNSERLDHNRNMKIGVIHEIHDLESFDERGTGMLEETPQGIENYQGCLSMDGTVCTCVWEAESVNELSQFIDPTLGDASDQEYFEINEEGSVGVPD